MITFKNDMPLKDYDAVSLSAMLRAHLVEKHPVAYTQRLDDAIQVASYLHRNDVRRGARGSSVTPPYIEHPLRVAVRLVKYFGVTNPDLVLAAILHDTVEDHAYEFSEFEGVNRSNMTDEVMQRSRALDFISDHFGYEVASIVEAVSNPLMSGNITKAEKISAYQKHIERVVRADSRALILKFSDFVDNAGSLHHHYTYDDKKVTYFLDRYEPLIPIYRTEFLSISSDTFDSGAALERLDEVEKQFQMFRSAREAVD